MSDDHAIERELFKAMEEETEGLGMPNLDMERIRRNGRRRIVAITGTSAAVLAVGVGGAIALTGGGGTGKDSTDRTAAVGQVAAPTSAPPTATTAPTGAATSPSPPPSAPTAGTPPTVWLPGCVPTVGAVTSLPTATPTLLGTLPPPVPGTGVGTWPSSSQTLSRFAPPPPSSTGMTGEPPTASPTFVRPTRPQVLICTTSGAVGGPGTVPPTVPSQGVPQTAPTFPLPVLPPIPSTAPSTHG